MVKELGNFSDWRKDESIKPRLRVQLWQGVSKFCFVEYLVSSFMRYAAWPYYFFKKAYIESRFKILKSILIYNKSRFLFLRNIYQKQAPYNGLFHLQMEAKVETSIHWFLAFLQGLRGLEILGRPRPRPKRGGCETAPGLYIREMIFLA